MKVYRDNRKKERKALLIAVIEGRETSQTGLKGKKTNSWSKRK